MQTSRALRTFMFHTKRGRFLALLLLAALVISAVASVYVFFNGSVTSTVQSSDVHLVAGPDISGSCSSYPCASGSVSSTKDTATVTTSFFAANTGFSPVPATYYSNLLQINNTGTVSHSIKSIQISGISGTTADLGTITVYYCTTQTEFSPSGTPVTPSDCVGSFAITSTTGGSISGTFPQTIAKNTFQYIEVVAYAASGATSGSVTFTLSVQWA